MKLLCQGCFTGEKGKIYTIASPSGREHLNNELKRMFKIEG